MIRLVEFSLASIVFLMFVYLVGSVFQSSSERSHVHLALSASAGVAFVLLTASLWAYTTRANTYLGLVVIVFGGLGSIVRLHQSRGSDWRGKVPHISFIVYALVPCLMYSTTAITSRLFLPFLPFSNSNNDIASFIAGADNINRSGFAEYGRAQFFNIANGAKNEFTGASALISVLSRVSNLETWRIAIPAMCLVIFVTAIVLDSLLQELGVRSTIVRILGVVWALHAPMSATVQNNFFLSQALARLFLMAAMLLFLVYLQRASVDTVRTILNVALLIAGLGISYSAGAGLSIGVLGSWAAAIVVVYWRKTLMAARIGQLLLGVLLGSGLLFPRWESIVANFRFFSIPNITGWPSRTLVPNIVLGTGRYLPETFGSFVSAVFVVVFALLIISVFVRFRRLDPMFRLCVAMALILIALVASMMLRYGSTTYQTWKAFGSLQSLFIILVVGAGSAASRLFPVFLNRVMLCVVSAICISAVYSSQDTFRDITIVPSRGLVQAAGDPLLKEAPSLTVAFRPYFETMIAPIILDVRNAQFGSDTYIGHPNPDLQCWIGFSTSDPPSRPLLRRYGPVEYRGWKSCVGD